MHRPLPKGKGLSSGGLVGLDDGALAALLHTDAKSVRRLIDLNHASRLDHLLTALAVLGRRVEVSFYDEPNPALGRAAE